MRIKVYKVGRGKYEAKPFNEAFSIEVGTGKTEEESVRDLLDKIENQKDWTTTFGEIEKVS